VFGDLKKFLGGYRLEDDIFWIALAKALATTVNFVGLLDKYSHCFGDITAMVFFTFMFFIYRCLQFTIH